VRLLNRSSRCQRFVAAFAALLIAGLGIVQVVHLYDELASSDTSHSRCALCVLSHSPAVATAAGSAPAPIGKSSALVVADPQLHSRLLIAAAFIRPPPVL